MHVEIRSLGKKFGRVTALRDVTLDLPAGTRAALIGPNGSGKSTLVRAVMGMIAPSGEVRFDGVAAGEDRRVIAARIAYVPQVAPRIAAPVRELVRAIAALRGTTWSCVADVAGALALDLGEVANRPLRALSGGQRQKVLAALALASGAELLLLDEPTASMDPRSRAAFFGLVDHLPPTTTVLLCSHRLDEIRRLVDRVLVLAEGELVYDGSAADYLDRHAEALVEVLPRTGDAEPWLRDRGFLPGATGWWSKAVPAAERARLLSDLGRSLNGQVRDVLARDLERLEPLLSPDSPDSPDRDGATR
jgi:ABC-type multidrug transport system ATPase subunit